MQYLFINIFRKLTDVSLRLLTEECGEEKSPTIWNLEDAAMKTEKANIYQGLIDMLFETYRYPCLIG